MTDADATAIRAALEGLANVETGFREILGSLADIMATLNNHERRITALEVATHRPVTLNGGA